MAAYVTGNTTSLNAEELHHPAGRHRALPGTSFAVGDAAAPPLAPGAYDVVLCRHVLWALPEPEAVLGRWTALLAPEGRLVLIEGDWPTGSGLASARTAELVSGAGLVARTRRLDDPELWGGPIDHERYVVLGARRR